MNTTELAVSPREGLGKGPNRRLRADGKLPAVIYGTGETPVIVTLVYREFERLMRGADAANHLLNIKGAGVKDGTVAVIREIQRDPVTRRFLHVDLFRVNMKQETEFEVGIHAVGTPMGVREGGMLETLVRHITVRCLPGILPDALTINIEGLRLNQSLHVSDLELPEGVTLVTDPGDAIFTVTLLRGNEAVDAGDVTAPEVIGKKKETA